jgi:hypothetical protein
VKGTAELEALVAHEGAGEQPRFAQDLEAVATADDRPACVGEIDDGLHDGREVGEGAGAQVVAVGEPTREDDGVEAGEVSLLVEDVLAFFAEDAGDGVMPIDVAPRAGEDDDGEAVGH